MDRFNSFSINLCLNFIIHLILIYDFEYYCYSKSDILKNLVLIENLIML